MNRLRFFFLSTILFISIVKVEGKVRPNKDYALFISVTDYDEWNDLRNPISDAEAIAKELKEEYGFQTDILRNPTRNEIYQKLEAYRQMTFASNSQLFIFFSGHGDFREATSEGFFIPKDGKLDDPFQDSYIPHTRLERLVNNIPCDHILLAIDACFSGTFDRKIAIDRARPGIRPGSTTSLNEKQRFILRKLKHRSRLYLTSGGKERTPDGDRYSPFTIRILEGLRSYGIDDGILSFTELLGFMEKAIPSPRAGQFGTHEPGGSFLFIVEGTHPRVSLNPATRERTSIPRPNREEKRRITTTPPPEVKLAKPSNSNSAFPSYDGKQYKVVKLNAKNWTAENLNISISGSKCYNNNNANCNKFGRLYTWEAAKKACALLGSGWRLPTFGEWRAMAKIFGGTEDDDISGNYGSAANAALIIGGKSNFNARLGGILYPTGDFKDINSRGAYWSSTSENSGAAADYVLFSRGGLYTNMNQISMGAYCRCIKD